ncbi:MAG: hypothetical protein LBK42_06055 [Propionibacteriaceae bacterium]|nr:hypothetical protein [Propionibacteriaceae bacterium]
MTLAVVGLVVVGLVVGLIVWLGGDRDNPAPGPSSDVSTSASPSPRSSASTSASASASPSPGASASTPVETEVSASLPQTITTIDTNNNNQPAGQYASYCDTFNRLGRQIEEAGYGIKGYQPPDDFNFEDLDAVNNMVNTILNNMRPIVTKIVEVQGAGPPPDVSPHLEVVRQKFQTLIDAFAAVRPYEGGYMGRLMTAGNMAMESGIQDEIQAEMETVKAISLAVCS